MNNVNLTGRVGRDAEVNRNDNSVRVTFSLATSKVWKAKDGTRKERTDWHRITGWGERWEKLALYIKKGSLVSVTGEIHYTEAEKDGQKRTYTDIELERLEFHSTGQKQQGEYEQQPVTEDSYGDLPF